MTSPILENPIWESLASRHRSLAVREGDIARYPAEVAPFLGVASDGVEVTAALELLVPRGDTVLLLGPVPHQPQGWALTHLAQLAQMVCPARVQEVDGPMIIELSEPHRADVLALTTLVYPHYFRPRTIDLGRYFGLYQHGRLAAMIGERMGMEGHTEISAVCTHPDFNGLGYARHLLTWLSNDNLRRGHTPFLHVSQQNQRAMCLYERNGYRTGRNIAFWSLRRIDE
ncbi:MAG: GNAT family N-acetyltransferase [Pseudoxanthomonas sp.]